MTWASAAPAAGVAAEQHPPCAAALGPSADSCRNSVSVPDNGRPADSPVSAVTLARRGGGTSLASHRQPAPSLPEPFTPRVREASSGWEWGMGSAGLAAWLLGLRRRFSRSKA
jgi:hypothetical protein